MSQPCAKCKGPTVKRVMYLDYVSNYCPKCGVYTADSDGKEAERIQHYVSIALPIVIDILKGKRKTA